MSGEAVFKIVQQNQFKASDHLKLIFRKGNDENIKKYLASKLKEATQNNAILKDKSSSLEIGYQKAQETNEQLMYEIQQLREENRRVVDQMKIEEQKKVNEVKEKMLVEQSEMQARNELEKKDEKQIANVQTLKFEDQIEELQKKILEQADKIQSILDQKRDIETENKDQQQKISH